MTGEFTGTRRQIVTGFISPGSSQEEWTVSVLFSPSPRTPSPRPSGADEPSFLRRTVRRLGGREPAVLVSVFLLLAAGLAFIKIADAVSDGETHRFDNWVLRELRTPDDPEVPIGPAWLTEVARDVTSLGGYACLILFTLIVAGFLWLNQKKHLTEMLLVSTVSGYLFSTFLKWIFQRPRPEIVPHLSEVISTSFPSGHSMNSAVVYLTLGALVAASVKRRKLKVYVLCVALVLTIAVGLSRVYLGVHYPTDVAAGWMAGLGWALLCLLVARFLQRKGQVESPGIDDAAKGRSESLKNVL